ncbi:MAG TPA: 50S ribosomal protein L15 [Candidatus Moranbacteria bacterium]|nr:50S ribosomal protein L15 [Candidatus Moranbacteria bacterium]HAT74739.1 50S ribosomal protein L15 [Candidatus Moranbacteria bacterium]
MQNHDLQLSQPRKKRKIIGRGGKKGTYSGKGNKGQKARSGAHVNPLFEGGRSTLIDHMKKKRGFTSRKPKRNLVQLADLEKKFETGANINVETLVVAKLVAKKNIPLGIKILGNGKITKKFVVAKEIFVSDGVKKMIVEAGGEVIGREE